MREIKFRAWDTEQNCMYPLRSVQVGELGTRKKEIVMQYTGLKDKNGKEIYEGDVVLDAWGCKQLVELGPIDYSDYEDSLAGYGFGFPTHSLEDFKEKVEIIGNRYENPELLK